MGFARLVLRTTVGGLMVGHGLQKLQGSFGGPGLEGTEQMMGALGLHPARHQARAAALTETIGGALTATGFLSPLGPAMTTGIMAVAIRKVHGKNGVWNTEGGFEYPLTLAAAAFLLASEGPGPLSLDGLFGKHRSGFHWGLAELALALGATAATLALAERFRPEQGGSVGLVTGASSPAGGADAGPGTSDGEAAGGYPAGASEPDPAGPRAG